MVSRRFGLVAGLALAGIAASASAASAVALRTPGEGVLSAGAEIVWTNQSALRLKAPAGEITCAAHEVTLRSTLTGSEQASITAGEFASCASTLELGHVELAPAHLPWTFAFLPSWIKRAPPEVGYIPLTAKGQPAITASFPGSATSCTYAASLPKKQHRQWGVFELGLRHPKVILPETELGTLKLKKTHHSTGCPREVKEEGTVFTVASDGEPVESEE